MHKEIFIKIHTRRWERSEQSYIKALTDNEVSLKK